VVDFSGFHFFGHGGFTSWLKCIEEKQRYLRLSGTLAYMSPEQVRGERVDARSDEFSLGIVLYELLTGQRPYADSDATSIQDAILHTDPPPPEHLVSSIPGWLSDCCRMALAKEPTARYSSCEEFATALRSGGQSPARPVTAKQRNQLAIAGGTILVLAAVALLAIWGASYIRRPGTSSREIAADGGGSGGSSVDSKPTGMTEKPTDLGTSMADFPEPFRWFRFENEESGWSGAGSDGREHPLPVRGAFTFTAETDVDAPPGALGTGVRFWDGADDEALLPSKTWLTTAAWTISFWFRRQNSENDDFLLYQGEAYGKGGGSCPQLNVWLTPQDELRILNLKTFRDGDIDLDRTVPGITSGEPLRISMLRCRGACYRRG